MHFRTIAAAFSCLGFAAVTACSAGGSSHIQPLPNTQSQSVPQRATQSTAVLSPTFPFAVTNCTSSAACLAGTNTGSGPGVAGTGSHASGVVGITKFTSTSTASAYGIFGQDSSTSGTHDAGVYGVSVRGVGLSGQSTSNYGVSGTSAQSYGVFGSGTYGVLGTGTSTYGIGVYGVDTATSGTGLYGRGQTYGVFGLGSGYGVYGTATSGVGVYGAATSGSGGQFIDTSPFKTNATSFGVRATSTSGFGLRAHSDSNYGALITSSYIALETSGSSIGMLSLTPSTGDPFVVQNTNGLMTFFVDGAGNIHYHGTLNRILRISRSAVMTSFNAHTVHASIEDAGTAQLVNGRAVVLLAAAFARAIDARVPYRVFLSAQSDTPGLYVAAKRPQAFVVRELHGGRGSFAFDYHLYGTALDK